MGVFKRILERNRVEAPTSDSSVGGIMHSANMSSDACAYSIVPIENGFMLVQTDDTYDKISTTKLWFYATPSEAANALAAKITAARIKKG